MSGYRDKLEIIADSLKVASKNPMIMKDLFLEQVEYKFRRTPVRRSFGQAIGFLLLDTVYPRIPGDIGNATTYPFPVRLKVVKGVYLKDVLCKVPSFSVCQRFVDAAVELEAEGVRAITTSCGYMVYFQDELVKAVKIPVFSSSLIQVPLVSKMLGQNRRVGIICADSRFLTDSHLKKAGIDNSMLVSVVGLDRYWSLIRGQKPKNRLEGFEKALSKVAREFISKYPDTGAIVLECTNFPPGAAALQEAVGLPVFDIVTLTYMIHDVVTRKRYSGYM
jgi:Asp/Glu/hydantoin racemase